MRQRLTNPALMCKNHLLGEHVELHMAAAAIITGRNISGFLRTGLLNPVDIKSRHELLVCEIKARGYNHKSELPDFDDSYSGFIDPEENNKLLIRCEKCRELHKKGMENGLL